MKALKILTIDIIRNQCNVDWTDEDALLMQCGMAAEDAVIDDTRRTIAELNARGYKEETGSEPAEGVVVTNANFPSRLKMAMLMVTAQLFAKKEPSLPTAQNLVQYSYAYLVKPYRKLV